MWFRLFGLMLWMFHVAAQTPEGEFTVVSDIQYCTGGGRPLLMDVFVPKHRNRTPTPAVLWIHGGGWERGDKNGNSGAQLLAHEGFVTASLFYRLSGDFTLPRKYRRLQVRHSVFAGERNSVWHRPRPNWRGRSIGRRPLC